MADIIELKRMLNDRVMSVVEYLLPNGRKEANEWRAGSTAGEKGKSLGVHLSGQKAGVWSDFSTGEGGDLIDLWSKRRGQTIAEAIEDISNWLGVSRPVPTRDPKPSYARPERPKCSQPKAKVREYLAGRCIPDDVLETYKIGERGDEIIFPFLLPDGVLAMAKSRKAENGAKPVPTAANCEPILFGWQAIDPNARTLIITEGEIDALSWACFGFPAVSVPFGGGKGGKQRWIENEFERLERFERIYLSTDMDGPGDEAAEEIASRLGRHRCLRVHLPFKDANKCLIDGVSGAEMERCLSEARSLDPAGLRRPSDLLDRVIYLFWPGEGDHVGYGVPYDKISGKLLFRPGELSLWSGASGHGKSQILSDCIGHWVKQGSRVCVASLEMKGEQTLKRLAKQTGGVDRPTAPFITKILDWLDSGLLIYDHVGKAGIPALLEVFDYARAKYGCDQFIIDSLMRVGIAQDDYNGQEKAVFQLVDWTIENNVHVHLVAHSRKGDKDRGGAPETEDIKGAMEIGANAFNILTVWRNKDLEGKIKAAKTEEERTALEEKPSVILNVAKQRNGDFEGKVGLWFDQATYRYHTSSNRFHWDRQYIPRGSEVPSGNEDFAL
ncbi:bifunctional DNA primase/helicase [Sinorhizobium sp. BJ1]|uniref:bifunctional DNA primase/helicase n=1 Tax=Sinorhizobium sp. BJ1 TaxID=2035455 RepID=UPI000BE9244B|nr:bifunctional DNA primase/helicase [Sinorhizobium sp. BJ1]PDT82915.1 DNA primase [Sinorhizobium sp. BJ1]